MLSIFRIVLGAAFLVLSSGLGDLTALAGTGAGYHARRPVPFAADYRDHRHHRRMKKRDPFARDHRCTARHALQKARDMGIRNARIRFDGPHSIGIRGRRDGRVASIAFARSPYCPVLR